MKLKLLPLIFAAIITTSSFNVQAAETTPPTLMGKSAIAIDVKSGEIIYSKNLDVKIYPASTTKLLTAILLTETKKPSDELIYSVSAAIQPDFSINLNKHKLNVGEKITADNAMKGLLVYSANDIAYMIASSIIEKPYASGDEVTSEFSDLMNKKIKELGLKNTHFVKPNGLPDPQHYSTAYDMSVIAKKAFANPWILSIVKEKQSNFQTEAGVKISLTNRNKIIIPTEPVYDKTCIGGKTGYTDEAGKCLVALYERDGRQVIGVVMKSIYDKDDLQVYKDMNNLINYSYSQPETTLYKKDSIYKTETITYRPLKYFGPTKVVNVPLILKENVNYYKNTVNDQEKTLSYKGSELTPWSLNKDNPIGTLTLTERGLTKNYKIYTNISTSDIVAKNKLLYGLVLSAIIAIFASITVLIIKIVRLFKKNKSYF